MVEMGYTLQPLLGYRAAQLEVPNGADRTDDP